MRPVKSAAFYELIRLCANVCATGLLAFNLTGIEVVSGRWAGADHPGLLYSPVGGKQQQVPADRYGRSANTYDSARSRKRHKVNKRFDLDEILLSSFPTPHRTSMGYGDRKARKKTSFYGLGKSTTGYGDEMNNVTLLRGRVAAQTRSTFISCTEPSVDGDLCKDAYH